MFSKPSVHTTSTSTTMRRALWMALLAGANPAPALAPANGFGSFGAEAPCCSAGTATNGCSWNTCPTALCSPASCTKCPQSNGLYYCPAPPTPAPAPTPPTPPTPAPCTGTSGTLPAAECLAFRDLYDATSGAQWSFCSDNRLDPCG